LVGIVLKVLDLQDELSATHKDLCEVNDELQAAKEALQATKEALQVSQSGASPAATIFEFPDAIRISEFATADGFLSNPPGEETWIGALSHKTELDVRAILSGLPTEVGLHKFLAAYKKGDKLLHALIKVWVVPVAEEN
jgi:hypothetical protein